MLGRTVSHYQIIENLGKGGMGEIYKAFDPRLNRFVAIKVLPARMSVDPARRRRFVQEAQAASGLNHPNIITIYDVVLEEETEFMLMEFVAGKTLLDLIPSGGLRIPQVLNYGVQIADALSAAHAAGIVHRDLKPGNVMVTEAGLVKILDFGLAKLEPIGVNEGGDEAETVVAEALTVEGSILGTVHYMSPEQAQGWRVDARSDIFSFGVLLYEMVSGVRPFSGDSPISTLSAILRDEPRPVSEVTADVPKPLQEVILRCLRKAPNDRWQSMQEVRTVLAALKQESDSTHISPKELKAEPPRRSRATAPLVVGGIIVATAAAGGWWLAQHKAPKPEAGQTAAAVGQSTPEPPAISERRAPLAERPPSTQPAVPPQQSETGTATPATDVPAVVAPKTGLQAPPSIILADGVRLGVTLTDDIPINAPEGTPIRFTVIKDLEVGGVAAIRKGALVKGEIAQEAKKKFLVFSGKLMMRMLSVEAVDGRSLNVRATPSRRADGQLWRPVDAGVRIRSKGVAAVAGTPYFAFVDGEQTVGAQK